jgi:large subunit ribosomal protein L25
MRGPSADDGRTKVSSSMPDVALSASLREERGSKSSRRLRRAGQIPAVLYGHGSDPLAITVDARALRQAYASQSGGGVLFGLSVGGKDHLVITREIQRHPVRRTINHIDFQIVSRDEIIPGDVSIQLVGEALGVTRNEGNVEHSLQSIRVHAKPADMPSAIEVDITDLEIGQAIRVADLALPKGVTTDLDPETTVVVGHARAGVEVGAETGEGGEATAASAEAPSESSDES